MCSDFNGENYCGPLPTKIHYMAIKCEPGTFDIMNCYRELAEGCTHDSDVIVECTNIDYDLP